jgi:hypothetical protein
MDEHASLIEVLNGPGLKDGTGQRAKSMESEYFKYLNLGFHLSPTADQDNHYRTWGTITNARTGLIAPSLTKESILEAMADGHAYATEDKNLKITCWIERKLSGEFVLNPDRALRIALRIEDDDEPNVPYTVKLYSDRIGGILPSQIASISLVGDSDTGKVWTIPGINLPASIDYIVIKIIQHDENEDDKSWLAPTWFD